MSRSPLGKGKGPCGRPLLALLTSFKFSKKATSQALFHFFSFSQFQGYDLAILVQRFQMPRVGVGYQTWHSFGQTKCQSSVDHPNSSCKNFHKGTQDFQEEKLGLCGSMRFVPSKSNLPLHCSSLGIHFKCPVMV